VRAFDDYGVRALPLIEPAEHRDLTLGLASRRIIGAAGNDQHMVISHHRKVFSPVRLVGAFEQHVEKKRRTRGKRSAYIGEYAGKLPRIEDMVQAVESGDCAFESSRQPELTCVRQHELSLRHRAARVLNHLRGSINARYTETAAHQQACQVSGAAT